MKFQRNARILRTQLDAAPFATVFFILVMFLSLSSLVYTPGVPIRLPAGADLPGTDQPALSVAVDRAGRLYFENQLIEEADLKKSLGDRVRAASEPMVLILQADESVTQKSLVQLAMLARETGITNLLWATLPAPLSFPVRNRK
jgi:biopolymer transport protein ExbD